MLRENAANKELIGLRVLTVTNGIYSSYPDFEATTYCGPETMFWLTTDGLADCEERQFVLLPGHMVETISEGQYVDFWYQGWWPIGGWYHGWMRTIDRVRMRSWYWPQAPLYRRAQWVISDISSL